MQIKDEFATSTLNIAEAARLLGFKSVERLRQKLRMGKIPGFKIGKNWMIRKSALSDLIARTENENLIRGQNLKKS